MPSAIGPDGLSRLRFGVAVSGERQKGVRGVEAIAERIVALYDPRWLERELTTRSFPNGNWKAVADAVRRRMGL